MRGFYSCMIAISMYSRIPVPRVEWTEERMAGVMCWFPVVGLVEGAALALWFWLGLHVFRFTALFTALAGTAVPLLITGGIHMDGFMDTVDALHSYGDREKKLRILKDPHIGAFAAIWLAAYMLLYAGILYEYASLLVWADSHGAARLPLYLIPGVVFTMERALSGLSVVAFPSAKKEGLAAGFAETARKKREIPTLLIWVVFCGAAPAWSGIWGLAGGIGTLAVQLGVFAWYYRMCTKEFGGVTGDLAGWFLQMSEAACLGGLVLLMKVMAVGGAAG